jgi:hypothetical protein
MEPINQFWMVVGRMPSGRFTGQSNVAHNTLAAAEAEALRLAAKDPGTTFFALAAVYGALAQKPTAQPVPIRGAIPEPSDIIDYMEAKAAASPPAGDWITWTGGPNPAPGKTVQYRINGRPPEWSHQWHADKLFWDWRHGGGGSDITAYRVVQP